MKPIIKTPTDYCSLAGVYFHYTVPSPVGEGISHRMTVEVLFLWF